MSQDMRVALVTSLKDQLVGPLRRSLDEVEKHFQRVEGELKKTTQAANQTGQALSGMQGPMQAAKQVAELSRNTENAIKLADRLKTAWSQAGGVMRGVAAGVAGFQAAKFVMAPALQDARTYDRRLRDLGNTAFGELSGDAFTAKIGTLDALIKTSLRAGGGTREGAVDAASTLMAQGGLSEAQLGKVMPTIMRAATAANAAPTDIANVVAAALKNGHSVDVIEAMIGKAIASGQAGGFEMKDMAKWLPKLLAAGSAIGMTGAKDYEEILALAQVSRTTAGSSDEAGNNLLNFLLKVNSNDTQNDAKKQGVDLSGTLAKNRDKGTSAALAFLGILRQEMDKDPRIVKLREQYAKAGNDGERLASLKAQEQIFGGSAMGKYLQDRQALMPAIGALNNPAELERQLKAVRAGGVHTLDRSFGNIADGVDFKHQQAENAKLFALTDGLNPVNKALSKLDERTTELYQKYPGYATVVETAKWAMGGAAAGTAAANIALGIFTKRLLEASAALPGVPGGAKGPGGAPAVVGFNPLAAGGMVLAAGAVGSVLGATSTVQSNSEAFANMGADAGDTAFAAAIFNAQKEGQAQRDAEEAARAAFLQAFENKPIQATIRVDSRLMVDGREIAAQVQDYMGLEARRK